MVLLWALAAAALELADTPRLAEDLAVEAPGIRWVLDDGLLFGVVDGDGAPAGFAFVGSGGVEVDLEPVMRPVWGNTLATLGKRDPAELRPLVDGAVPFTDPLEVALFLGPDAEWTALLRAQPEVAQERGALYYVDEQGQEQVVVTELGLGSARSRAAAALRKRSRRLAQVGLDPDDALTLDRADGAGRRMVEARIDTSLRPFLEPAWAEGAHWLSWVEDPTGGVDPVLARQVYALGLGPGEVPRWRTLSTAGSTLPEAGPAITRATTNVVLEHVPSGLDVTGKMESVLTVRADRRTSALTLAVPRAEDDLHPSMVSPHAFAITAVETWEGAALTRVSPGFGRFDPGDEVAVWALPEPLEAGAEVRLVVRHEQRWGYIHQLDAITFTAVERRRCSSKKDCEYAGPEQVALGRGLIAKPVVPRIPGAPPPERYEVRLGTTAPDRHVTRVTGFTEERTEGDGRWVVGSTSVRPTVSMGRWSQETALSVRGFPRIDIFHADPDQPVANPVFLRQLVNFYGPALPDYPADHIEVLVAPARPYAFDNVLPEIQVDVDQILIRPALTIAMGSGWAPSHRQTLPGPLPEQLSVGREGASELSVRNHHPLLMQRALAEAVAAQWWTRKTYARRDLWIAPTMAALYRDLFSEHVLKKRDRKDWAYLRRRALKEDVPRDAFAPFDGRPSRVQVELGAALFGDLLRPRIGERALLEGLDRFLVGPDATTEALQAALEEAAGTKLDDFFATYIFGGFLPRLELEHAAEGDALLVTVRSDVPFATFEVPVDVHYRKGKVRRVWVEVVDGEGTARLPLSGDAGRVVLDPDRVVPRR